MPRTFGDSIVHQSHFDFAACIDEPLPEHGGKPPTDQETRIGQLIAENLVVDGATLQMGIGNVSKRQRLFRTGPTKHKLLADPRCRSQRPTQPPGLGHPL